jgi:rhodanese-related sulfurtransferase
MAKKILVTLILLVTCAFLHAQSDFDKKLKSLYKNTVPTIRVDALQKYIKTNKQIILLDTRAEEEYKVSHLRNAVFIDYGQFKEKQVLSIDRNSIIVVYCSVGYRSERIGEKLQKLGFKNVSNLYGGIFQWKNEGHVVVNSKSIPTDSVHTYNKNWSQWLSNGIRVF